MIRHICIYWSYLFIFCNVVICCIISFSLVFILFCIREACGFVCFLLSRSKKIFGNPKTTNYSGKVFHAV